MKPYTTEEMKPWDAMINAMTPEEMRLELHCIVRQLGPEIVQRAKPVKDGIISNCVAYAMGMLDALGVVLK